MRIKTPINKETVSGHMHYSLWKYALIIAAAWMGWSLLFTVTAYRSPQNKRIDLYVQSFTATSESINAFIEPIWKETVPEMETVEGVVLMPLDDYTTSQQLMTYTMAGDMDVVFLNNQYFKNLAEQNTLIPLDDLVADGTLDVGDVDLTNGYVTVVAEYDEQDRPVKTARRLYGIPLDAFDGFVNGMQLDNRGMYATIMVNNGNDANVVPFFNALLQAGLQGQESAQSSDTETK
ncbi:MAG: hypothetical protein IKH57_25565 [Clostridia bacterium]|nr:hypothetical protein [Clostridia bacterium]